MGFDGPGLKIGRTNKAAGFGQISSLLDNGRMWAVRKLNRRDYQYRYQYARNATVHSLGLTVGQPPGNHSKLVL